MHISFVGLLLCGAALAGCAGGTTDDGLASSDSPVPEDTLQAEVLEENLAIPWGAAFLPNGDMLITERSGQLLRIGEANQRYVIEGVEHVGEGGLLGLALHPDFADNRQLYLYFTTTQGDQLTNRVERYRFENDELTDQTEILSGIPGASYHDGGRIAFGPDNYLYITTGDAGVENLAQDTQSLAGKILRLEEDGSIPADNPFGNAVYSYGHRNPQGLTWDEEGRLWSTEHGRSGRLSGYDELNVIEPGANYGWPQIQGDETVDGMRSPVVHSGPNVTWAPASAHYRDGSVFFGGLRGQTFYQAILPDDSDSEAVEVREHFVGEFGRIRTVFSDEDGRLYFTTSNRDGRGSPAASDDRIVLVQ